LPLPSAESSFSGNRDWSGWLTFVGFNLIMAVLVSLILLFQYLPTGLVTNTVLGQPAGQTIYAPRYVRYVSSVQTQAAKQAARNDPTNLVYDYNASLIAGQSADLQATIRSITAVRGRLLSAADKLSSLVTLPGFSVQRGEAQVIISLSETQWQETVSDTLRTFDVLMNGRRIVDARAVDDARSTILALSDRSLDEQQRLAEQALVGAYLKPNVLVNETASNALRDKAEAAVSAVTVEVQKNQIVVSKGEIVTAQHVETLERIGLTARAIDWEDVIGTVGLVTVLLLVASSYLFLSHHQMWQRRRPLLLIAMCLLIPIGSAHFITDHVLLPYLLPFASFSILLAVLLNTDVGIVYTIIISLLVGLLGNNNFELTVFYLVSGMVGIYAAWRAERSSDFVRAGLAVAAINYLVIILSRILSHSYDNTALLELAGVSLLNGVLSAAFSFAAFNLLGNLFGTTTPLQLLELAHPTQPLLRRLMYDAPGTYHHSLVVGNLAERAAEVAGTDPLLARVGAYYHDIGKVLHPAYFIDNQTGMDNIHDSLPPRESAYIISDHVRDGVELAKKYRLPKRVSDIVAQHHGTTAIRFFYDKAVAQEGAGRVDKADYQYPGPRPRTKEAAIVMLADSVEAATRAAVQSGQLSRRAEGESGQFSSNFDEEQLGQVVHKVIGARLAEGQLDECDLTIRDIASIEGAFRAMLRGIYHPRIVYPDRKTLAATSNTAEAELPAVLEPVVLSSVRGGTASHRQRNLFALRKRGKPESRS